MKASELYKTKQRSRDIQGKRFENFLLWKGKISFENKTVSFLLVSLLAKKTPTNQQNNKKPNQTTKKSQNNNNNKTPPESPIKYIFRSYRCLPSFDRIILLFPTGKMIGKHIHTYICIYMYFI